MITKNINSQPEFAETDTFSEICVCNGWSEYGPLHSGCNTCMAVAGYYAASTRMASNQKLVFRGACYLPPNGIV